MKYSIKKQMIVLFIGLMVCLLAANWILNSTLLESYYISKKKNVLIEAYQSLNKVQSPEEYKEESFKESLEYICSNNNISFVLLNAERKIILGAQVDAAVLEGRVLGFYRSVDDPQVKILEETNRYTIQKIQEGFQQSDYLEIWGTFDTSYYYSMRIPIQSIRENVKISNEFLIYSSVIGITVGVILIWWISKKITEPIQELTVLSQKMTELNFEEKYKTNGRNELDLLGEHFNQMAETLESTIAELKTANNELQKDIEKKEEIDEMRKEFLANVSHELKTPIALIQGYAEGLTENINEDAASRDFYCEVIMDETSKMNQMVKKLLTLNQLEFGNDTIVMERFDVSALICGVIQATDILAKQKKVRIAFREDKPVYVWADEYKVEEVITNYVSNALNHVEDDKVIDIRIQKNDGKVRISVFNTGKAIPQEDIENIWIKFYKVDKARTREYGGNGIGLSIVKAIMESFNQKYGVANYDNGVEFWFELDGEKRIVKNLKNSVDKQ